MLLAAASSFFNRTNISQSYNIGSGGFGSRSSTPVPSAASSGASLPPPAVTPTFHVGPWKVQSATHKVTGKRVSVWTYDKRSESDRYSAHAKERVIEILKAEASALGRLRHPSILEMVEPLEETRSELIFATEPLLSSLYLSVPTSPRASPLIELDEVEMQKGILQLCNGLTFLHTSARVIHSNINPESVLINSSGDWKIGGLGLTIPINGADGSPTSWRSPMYDSAMPNYVQRSFDYLAPEYVLDEQLVTASDMYSLGCLIYAVHNKSNPPFKNYNSSSSLRENAGKPVPGVERSDPDLKALLASLITRHPQSRPTPATISSYPFFSSLPISTLNFLDRSTFASKSREEKISFMKGLTGVLDRFSNGLKTRKILPSLVEEMKDTHLLPHILPNVFAISNNLSPTQFATQVLPSLKPLFAIKEPPQNMITLLDNLQLLQEKTDKGVFREHVLPLVYNALESEHAVVQERALKVVPHLCETIDYAEVQGVLFPRVALVFTKTRILSVKVTTLQTFLSMVNTLDQTSVTQKLVPLLSRIRTKEPAVMLATLAVQEAMGQKVDREAVATLVLPQLWTMSMGPLLNLEQFQRFMSVIRKLGDRVEHEHAQHLRDSQRLEDSSATGGVSSPTVAAGGSLDFESLVAGAKTTLVKPDIVENGKTWEDDVWGSLLSSEQEPSQPMHSSPIKAAQSSHLQSQSLPSSPRLSAPPMSSQLSQSLIASGLGKRTVSSPLVPLQAAPHRNLSSTFSTLQSPMHPQSAPNQYTPIQPTAPSGSKPNYNVTLPPATPLAMATSPPLAPISAMNSALTPMTPVQTWQQTSAAKILSKSDWGDFDPLS